VPVAVLKDGDGRISLYSRRQNNLTLDISPILALGTGNASLNLVAARYRDSRCQQGDESFFGARSLGL
jgi:hypothetical protein